MNPKKAEKPRRRIAWKVLLFLSGFIVISALPFGKNNPKNEIIILIDRPPNTLTAGQTPDMMARKILPLIHELHYSAPDGATLEDFVLMPPTSNLPGLHFKVIRDDLTRGVWFKTGRSDVLFDTLSLSKTDQFRKEGSNVLIANGFHLSFLGFNLKHPVLSRLEVRRAIAKALPISLWIRSKYFDFVEALPKSQIGFDPSRASLDLDQAGFPSRAEEPRFTVRYLTTPVREGFELALLVREALKPVGIRVEIIPLEPSLFFSKLLRGEFELFGSRIPRSSAEAPLMEYLITRGRRNYFSYSNPHVDQEFRSNPEASLDGLLPAILEDLPFVPLFTWKHGVLLSERVTIAEDASLSPDDSFRFLKLLRLK